MTEEYTEDDARTELRRTYIFRETDVMVEVSGFNDETVFMHSVHGNSQIELDLREFQQFRGMGILLPA